LRRLGGERGAVRGGDHRLPHARNARRQHLAPSRVELGQDVVEEEQRRRRQQLCLGQEERQHGESLLALRAELAQVAVTARDRHVVEVRAGAGRPALQVARESRVEVCDGGRLRVVGEPRFLEQKLARAGGEAGREELQGLAPMPNELRAEGCDLLGPRLEGVPAREPELHAAERCVALRERREVVLGHRGTGREEPAESAVEVRAACGRPALHDSETVGCEDERRHLAAEGLRGRKPGAVQPRLLRLPLPERHRELDR
jgi:hypothetical protein